MWWSAPHLQRPVVGLPRVEVVVAGPLVHVVLGPVLARLQGGGGHQPAGGPGIVVKWWMSFFRVKITWLPTSLTLCRREGLKELGEDSWPSTMTLYVWPSKINLNFELNHIFMHSLKAIVFTDHLMTHSCLMCGSQRVSMSPSPVFTLHTAWSQASLCCCPAWCHSGTDSDPTYAMAQVTGKVDTTIKIVWTHQNLNSYCIVNSSANTFIAGKECDVPCDVLVSWWPASTPGVARSVCPVRRRSAIVGSSHAQGERWPRAETIYNVK